MAITTFGSLLEIEASWLCGPPAVLHRDALAVPAQLSIHELDQLTFGTRYNSPSPEIPVTATPKQAQIPTTPNDLEMSRPASPSAHGMVDVVQTLWNPPMNRWRFVCACCMSFGQGANDSAAGALIPYMESNYNIGYAIVSLIFVANAIGFIGAAPFTNTLQARFGRAKVLVFAAALVIIGYIMVVSKSPFSVVVVGFLFTGFGMATILALNNVFCANLANGTTTLGVFHGSYGIGGIVGPLMATGLVSNGYRWSTLYLVILGITVCNMVFAYWAFRNYEQDLVDLPLAVEGRDALRQELNYRLLENTKPILKDALRNKTTTLGALFIFCYQGAEVSISGWLISFLLNYRSPPPSSRASVGYVTAGFWAGITLGRFLLSHPCHLIGEKVSVIGCIVGAIGFQLLVWLVPNVIGEAIAVATVGLLIGPIFPCATTVFSKLIGRKLQMSSLAFVSAMGSSGGAMMPFLIGLISQRTGTWVLHPIVVALFAAMIVSWACLDRVGKRSE